jgi:hypothetical protein
MLRPEFGEELPDGPSLAKPRLFQPLADAFPGIGAAGNIEQALVGFDPCDPLPRRSGSTPIVSRQNPVHPVKDEDQPFSSNPEGHSAVRSTSAMEVRMRPLALLLVPAALLAAPARFARLGEFDGKVEAQLHPADPWMSAQRNLPLPELAWLRTGEASKVEIELDEGSAWRLGPGSQGEISDYSRLSTGQRVTLLSLDRGVAYFTGEPEGKDALTLAVPGAQITLRQGARLRLEAQDSWSQIAVIEGMVRFSSPAAEIDLRAGQTVRVEPANAARFFLFREVTPMALDGWSEDRDKALESPASARYVLERYGLLDLDANGEWIQTEDLGAVWKPKAAQGWTPYRDGHWLWVDALGYTWVSDDPWGWLTDHYGRWLERQGTGWIWAPSQSTVFKPGEVYWLLGAKFAGWGPLAPGEQWAPAKQPQQFLNANTTYARFRQDAKLIDPAGFQDRPKDPLGAAAFTLALPSPALPAARLDAVRPVLRAGSTRVVPVLPGVTYQNDPADQSPDDAQVSVLANPGAADPPVVVSQPPDLPPLQPPQGPDVYYPASTYSGIIVVNPPERPDGPTFRKPTPWPAANKPVAQNPAAPPPARPIGTLGPPGPPAKPPVDVGTPQAPVHPAPAPSSPPAGKPAPAPAPSSPPVSVAASSPEAKGK